MIPSRLDRYILRAVVRAALLSMLAFVGLGFVLFFAQEAQLVGRGNYELGDALLYVALTIPRFLVEVAPVATLIGAVLVMSGMANHGELDAMRSAGYSRGRMLRVQMFAGILLAILVVVVSEYIGAPAERYADQRRTEALERKATLRTEQGFWVRDGNSFVNIGRAEPGGRLFDIRIYELDQNWHLRLATYAKRAVLKDGEWRLQEIRQAHLTADTVLFRNLASASWVSILDPELLALILVKPRMLPVWQLWDYVRAMRRNKQDSTDFEVVLWSKISSPIVTLVMLLVAGPLVMSGSRRASTGNRVFIAVVLGTVLFFASRIMNFSAAVYGIPPALAAFLPAVLFAAGAYLLSRKSA